MYPLINETNSEVMYDYHLKRPFSGFLPGVAGTTGIPIWCFYVNRGQGVSGFGIKDKNDPIMEFFPANQAYQYVNTYGFRTFIKIEGEVIEPFTRTPDSNHRTMYISKDSFSVEEVMEKEALRIKVTYSALNELPVGGLVRRVSIQNMGNKRREVEIIDGMPALIPHGITNTSYKEMSNLGRSWMQVSHCEEKLPYFNLRAGTSDEAEVSVSPSGYFYLNESLTNANTMVIYDAAVLFSYRTDLSEPVNFKQMSLNELEKIKQIPENKVPCAFQGIQCAIEPTEEILIDSVIGYAKTYEKVKKLTQSINFREFITNQLEQEKKLIETLTQDILTRSANRSFNAYIAQSYLDNILRGGKPYIIGDKQTVCHLFSRKHGDQEREYNFFSIEPKYYSQGNGNFRDVNQNRRHDVTFEPKVKDFNVWMFYSLIQSDGYNPLSINGIKYTVSTDNMDFVMDQINSVLILEQPTIDLIKKIIDKPFTPGELLEKIDDDRLDKIQIESLISILLDFAEAEIDASFGEGFWTDHFTYNLDLVEDYLSIYPENLEALLLRRNDYKIYNAPEYVLPRNQRIGLTKAGTIRQFGSLRKKEVYYGTWMTDETGKVVTTNLLNKMLMLVITKFLNLDPSNLGIEMEANKPGWNDAMNGLPGLLGSGMSETIELSRHLHFMLKAIESFDTVHSFDILTSLYDVISEIMSAIEKMSVDAITLDNKIQSTLKSWNIRNTIKEQYREKSKIYVQDHTQQILKTELVRLLSSMNDILEKGMETAIHIGEGIMPTYLIHSVEAFELNDYMTPYGLQSVVPLQFKCRILPNFLEAPARYIKGQKEEEAEAMYNKVKRSPIYDQQLKMYKTSESMEKEGYEIGRIRAFTPGWLERESIFMHMTYKYILGLAKAQRWDLFYEELPTNMICYLSKEVYGRPITENSSFIASSVNPDPSVRGQGFVARLSGSTAELMSMWKLMMVGGQWFSMTDGILNFSFDPNLTNAFFDEKGECQFMLLSRTLVTYNNKTGLDTFGPEKAVIREIIADGIKFDSNRITGEVAIRLREGKINQIAVFFDK